MQVRKFSDRATNLYKRNENLRRILKTCVKMDENHNFLVDINCNYEIKGHEYSCQAKNFKIGKENSTIEDVKGAHVRGKQTSDVTELSVYNQSSNFLPFRISVNFPRLKKLFVENSKLMKINRFVFDNLNQLTTLVIRGNQIESIEAESFDEMPKLFELDLSSNRIQKLPSKLFEQIKSLRNIDLSGNFLSSLDYNIIPAANSIESFLINNNKLAKIDPRISKRLFYVTKINFKDNHCINTKIDVGDDDLKKITVFGEITLNCLDGDDSGVY
jgi:Leucine-rich repeat (LRR) protein